jgi:hypothetical protein
MISDVPGATPDMVKEMWQAGLRDRLKAIPGFKGHWSGPTGSGTR